VAFPLLQSVAGLPEEELQRRLVNLQDAEFVYETARFPELAYTFKHVLTQEVAYASLLRSTRRQIHERIGQALAERFPETVEAQPELVAHHYTEAGLGEQAVGYWQRAGEHANARSAHPEAVVHLTRGVEVLKTLPETPQRPEQELSLQIALGTALTATKGWAAPEVEEVYTRARELCQCIGETPQLGPVLWGLWHFHAVRGRPQTARELGEQFLRVARRAREPAPLLAAHFVLGAALCLLGEFPSAREHWERSLSCYDPQQHRSHALLYGADPGVFCLAWSPHLLWQLGYADQALTRSGEALALARKLSHPFSSALVLAYAAMLHQFRRDPRAVCDLAEAAMTLCAEQEFAYYLAWGRIMRGWAAAEAGDRETGVAEMRRGLAALRATGAGLRQPYYLGLLAEACGKAGRAEEGLALLAEALKLVDDTGERWWEAELHRLKGDLLLRQALGEGGRSPRRREAEACFQRALAIARRQQAQPLALRAATSLCRLWQQRGKIEAAQQLLGPDVRLVHRGP
jgi:predicted ATPase